MKNLLLGALVIVSVSFSAEAKNCKKGKACGNSCIAMTDTCHKDEATKAKVCKKGKACGNTCIPQSATCTK